MLEEGRIKGRGKHNNKISVSDDEIIKVTVIAIWFTWKKIKKILQICDNDLKTRFEFLK